MVDVLDGRHGVLRDRVVVDPVAVEEGRLNVVQESGIAALFLELRVLDSVVFDAIGALLADAVETLAGDGAVGRTNLALGQLLGAIAEGAVGLFLGDLALDAGINPRLVEILEEGVRLLADEAGLVVVEVGGEVVLVLRITPAGVGADSPREGDSGEDLVVDLLLESRLAVDADGLGTVLDA